MATRYSVTLETADETLVRAVRDMRQDVFRVTDVVRGTRVEAQGPGGWEYVATLPSGVEPLEAARTVAKAMGWHS